MLHVPFLATAVCPCLLTCPQSLGSEESRQATSITEYSFIVPEVGICTPKQKNS